MRLELEELKVLHKLISDELELEDWSYRVEWLLRSIKSKLESKIGTMK